MSDSIFERIEQLLHQHGVQFDVLRHAPVHTSAEAAAVRGTALASGAKALVCKADAGWVMIVLPADRRLASKQVRKARAWKGVRFADQQEVLDLTGLAPGAIPPFGSLFALPTLCDRALAEHVRINFNAGDHSISVSMKYEDYLAVERPELGDFSEPPS